MIRYEVLWKWRLCPARVCVCVVAGQPKGYILGYTNNMNMYRTQNTVYICKVWNFESLQFTTTWKPTTEDECAWLSRTNISVMYMYKKILINKSSLIFKACKILSIAKGLMIMNNAIICEL